MQQQHLMQMQQPIMAAYYPSSNTVSSDNIQQYLDENKLLILKIVESQNNGKLNECAESQAKLQQNLMYLAAIADSQPHPTTMNSQYAPTGMMQSGSHYMQQQQQYQLMTQQTMMASRSPMLYGQQAYPSLQQSQALHAGQMRLSSAGSSGLNMLQGEPHGSTSSGMLGGYPDFARIKQDMGSSDGRGGSSSDGGEALYLKSGEE